MNRQQITKAGYYEVEPLLYRLFLNKRYYLLIDFLDKQITIHSSNLCYTLEYTKQIA